MEILIIIWLIIWLSALTLAFVFCKRGPQGNQGERGERGKQGEQGSRDWGVSVHEISGASIDMLDDSKYMTKLIAKLNSYQLTKGNEV